MTAVIAVTPSVVAATEFACWNPNDVQYELKDEKYVETLELINQPFDSGQVLNYIAARTKTDVKNLQHLRDVKSWAIKFHAGRRKDMQTFELVRIDAELQLSLRKRYEHAYSVFHSMAYKNDCDERIRVREFSITPTESGYKVHGVASGKVYKCVWGGRVDGGTRVKMWAGMNVSFFSEGETKPNELCAVQNRTTTYEGDDVGDGDLWTNLTNRLAGTIWAGATFDANKLDFIDELLPTLSGLFSQAGNLLPKVADTLPTLNLIKEEIEGENFELGLNIDSVSLVGTDKEANLVLGMATIVPNVSIDIAYPALHNFFQCLRDLKSDESAKHLVQPGQSLWRIARERYGYGEFYHSILSVNEGIESANSIFPNQEIALPVICPSSSGRTIIVENGESLWTIAEKLQISDRWYELVDLNRDRLRSENDDIIYPGQIVLLPDSPESISIE